MTKSGALFLALFSLSLPAFAGAPVVRGHEFVTEDERVPVAEAPAVASQNAAAQPPQPATEDLSERLAKDSEFIDDTGNLSFQHAVQALQHIYDDHRIYRETREEALRTLILRFERTPGRHSRSLQKYLMAKLRTKKEPLESKKLIYDAIAEQGNKVAIPAMVNIASDPAVHEFVRLEACKDLAEEKLKPGQKKIVRSALSQLASLKAVKKGEVEGVTVATIEGLLKKFW